MSPSLVTAARRRTALGLCVVVAVLAASTPVQAAAPTGRYAVMPTVVKDRRTGLSWRKAPETDRLTWVAAKAACSGILGDGGHWRLPTAMELQTLVDVRAHDPAIDVLVFPDTPSSQFWSSTPYVRVAGSYWAVDFTTGTSLGTPASATLSVRCVEDPTSAP